MMALLFTAALLMTFPVEDPSCLMPEFMDAIRSGDAELAVEMISPEAIRTIDSLLLTHPDRVLDAVAVFAIPGLEPDSIEDATSLLLELFGTPILPAMIGLTGVEAGEPFPSAERTFVRVTWSVFSESDTVFIELSSINEDSPDWRLLDFYTIDPRTRSRSTRASCSPR